MTMRLCLTACLAFAVGLIPVPVTAAEPENLLVNGSFEDGPDDIGGFTSLDKDSGVIKGWVVIGGQIDLIDTHWQAADGKRSLDLHGSPGYGGVAQTFKTEKGKKYKVTFSLAGNPGGTVAKKTIVVRAAGKEKEFTFDTTGKSGTDMGWKKETWEFTAEKAETTLELITAMTEDAAAGPALDDVSVIAVK
jgi:choice-of-anchor C domain-containing protein